MSKTPQKKPDAPDAIEDKIRLVRELAQVMDDKGLMELDLEDETISIHLSKTGSIAPAPMMTSVAPASLMSAPSPSPSSPTSDSITVSNEKVAPDNAITSPMVGTAYLAPEPGAAVFVKEGDSVKAGQTLLIIEAMKVMNPITAPSAGIVRQILIDDGQPVEFGEPLIVIE